jgi:EmrB/QacA subfamily drug resistance transporter
MIVPLTVACVFFMQALDSLILATALPAIASSLHEDPIRLNLAITSYMVSQAVFVAASGWLTDRFGGRRVFLAAIVIFTGGSIACGLSQSFYQLVFARIAQGMGGAIMGPVGQLLVLRTTPKHQLLRAMNYIFMPGMLGPILGPPVGGFIVTYASWRWIFFINVPVGIVALGLALAYIRETDRRDVGPLDWRGFLFAALGVAALMFGFENVGRDLFPPLVVAAILAVGVVGVALLVRHSRRHPRPLLDLSIAKLHTWRIANFGSWPFRIGMGAHILLMPMLLQIGFGLSAFASGSITFASAVGMLFMRATSTPILRRFGFRRVLMGASIAGSILAVAPGFFTSTMPHLLISFVLLITGLARSLFIAGFGALRYADVPQERMSAATTLTSMVDQLAISSGVAVGALVLHLAVAWHGGGMLTAGVFITVGIISILGTFCFMPLSPHAGADVSGHRHAEQQPSSAAALPQPAGE